MPRIQEVAAQFRRIVLLAVPAAALVALAPGAMAQQRVPVAAKAQPAAAPGVDAELLLRSCAGEARRNAKLYVARAHGIELMKRSADRDQTRSMLRIEAQLDATLGRLRGKGADAELVRMEDALVGLTELTLQQPRTDQVEAALRLSDQAAAACSAALAKLDAPGAAPAAPLLRLAAMLDTSQQLAGQFLSASLKRGGPSGAETAVLARLAAAFDAELGQLRASAADDPSLRDTLAQLDGQWLFVRIALERPQNNARTKIEDVGRASETLFELIDREMQRARRKA